MDSKGFDELRAKLASRVQLLDHLSHLCTHGGYFANISYVAPGELFEMLCAAELPLDSGVLLALTQSLEQFFTLPPILSVHGSRRLALEMQWWLKHRSSPGYDAEAVENRVAVHDADGQAAVLLPVRPLHIQQVFVLPSLPAQPSPAATCRVLDAAARNAALRIGHPCLEVLDLLGVQWAHCADVVNCLANAFHVLMQFTQQMDAGLQIAWGSHAPPSGGGGKDDPATAAHAQRMEAACASVQAFDTYIQSTVVQPVVGLLRGVARAKVSGLMGPLLDTQLWEPREPHSQQEKTQSTDVTVSITPSVLAASTGARVDPPSASESGAATSSSADPSPNRAPQVHAASLSEQAHSVPAAVLASSFCGVGWHPELPTATTDETHHD